MIKIKNNRKIYFSDFFNCFIVKTKNEYELKKMYFSKIKSGYMDYKVFNETDENTYFLIYSKKDYIKIKYSIFFDYFIPLQFLVCDDLLKSKKGKYIYSYNYINFEFIRDEKYFYSGVYTEKKDSAEILNYGILREKLKNIAEGDLNDLYKI
ncbi:MAG: hypothetical protein H7A31_00325 [Thermotogae bacterium]|nr:hypothetical protein [Thermotogota bacterium]MCP5465123.1 hypothetical protein [Thermotogota bacterium]HOO76095.1 hypothetical protein [Tepiditoga sp.]